MNAAILDACVLYPMELRDTLLRIAAAGAYRPHWTAEILGEMERNLVARGVMTIEQAARMRGQMEEAFPDAMVDDYASLIPQMPNHPKDRHVTAAAVTVEASVIVTSNLRDFAQLPSNMLALSPDDFLAAVAGLHPAKVLTGLTQQAAARHRPPKTVAEILARLENSLPAFVAAARKLLQR